MKRWIIQPKKSDDILEQLLINRKIPKKDWGPFLNPKFENLFEPFKMKNMKAAVQRIKEAREKKEIIGIFGDYDADGIPGTALLYEYLKKIGFEVKVYIPTREQGYGLNEEGIKTFKLAGVSLLITIDLGTRNINEIDFALKSGLDVIILDHHEMGPKIPAGILINPKQVGETYQFRELAGTGVVFKFIQAINQTLKLMPENHLKWYLDLVAIATICDVVPLVSENRIFAKFGLVILRKTLRLGLSELYKVARIEQENIDTYSVGFQIGPRINAPGRMNNANESFFLLISRDRFNAHELAEKLDSINRHRQNELERVLKEAREKVCKNGLDKKKIIMVEGKNWPQGIVGLVAGKLMEEFARPVIVCEQKENKLRGSARSIDAYNIIEALEEAKKFLTRFGGHKKAAGLSLELEHLSTVYDKLLEVAESKLKDEDLAPKITVDKKLEMSDLNLGLVDNLQKMEPYGLGNPRPVFMLEKVKVNNLKTVGASEKHLKFSVEDVKAIAFDFGNMIKNIEDAMRANQKIDLAFTIDEDNWDGRRKVQLKIVDIKINAG